MKVGVVGELYPDSLADNVIDGLHQIGHDAVGLGEARLAPKRRRLNAVLELAGRSPAVDSALQQGLLRRARAYRPDLILAVDARLSPHAVKGFKAMGCRVGLWFPDHVANIGRQLMFVAPYDAVFVKEPILNDRARALLGANISYVPEACNPSWHFPPPGLDVVPEVAVVGNMYPFRVRLLERLVAAGLPIRIYGPPFPRWLPSPVLAPLHTGRYVARQEKARAFRTAAAVLNGLYPAEIEGVNCRLFEATACGATVLCEARAELSRMFTGDEVLSFGTFDELVDQARWALDNPTAAREMGDRAAARALSDHTYGQRLHVILETLAT